MLIILTKEVRIIVAEKKIRNKKKKRRRNYKRIFLERGNIRKILMKMKMSR